MSVTSFTQEINCPIDAARMFKALIIESNTLIPKLLPQFIKSVDVIQGEAGEAGSIEQVNFTQASHLKYVKHRIDEVDKENLRCKYTMIEGDALGDKLEFVEHEIKFEGMGDGGCMCKMSSNYHTIGEFEIEQEEIKASKEQAIGIYKVVQAYLLDNPTLYA